MWSRYFTRVNNLKQLSWFQNPKQRPKWFHTFLITAVQGTERKKILANQFSILYACAYTKKVRLGVCSLYIYSLFTFKYANSWKKREN